ncbi:pyridoxamine 5'-phosphate oxidase family protein [Ideonella sp. A 288]|uniref:pyridoxamine 5'-phosphate oxidase family protein n=1 Tax=Ideonella sp. A 288 TaxID=1962181 RepID=UPI000B4A655F|nr:pyridoxamine 5'-phosphate oxidase family protein [Ideonella sp. A 288]
MNRSDPSPDPFHSGEKAMQARLGVEERMLDVGRRVIRPYLPEQHREFYAQLPFVLVGSVDALGRPWASVLVGEPGFMRSPDPTHLHIQARPVPGDPLAQGLVPGAPLGFLGIELHTRRRNRMNGRVEAVADGRLTVAVEQTVGNCPQYIQGRETEWARDAGDNTPRDTVALDHLDDAALALVRTADTLFVATRAPAEGEHPGSADVSHRGGRSGFVRVEDERTLLVPDFTGNFLFMTLGNLQLDPRAGVIFIDFSTGDLLTLTGRAEVVWDGPELEAFEGAERAWRFHIEAGWRLSAALPLRWRFRDWSPNSLITGSWDDAARRLEVQRLAQTWRPYRVARVVDESSVIRSFHLEPADGFAQPAFEAGQYLPIRLHPGGDAAPLQRTYTLSSAPGEAGLRISVKREGAASTFLHDQVKVGDTLEALGPRGHFTLDATLRRSAALIGAGVGITPMVSFARHLVAEGFRLRRTRPTHLIQVARDGQVRAFASELEALAARAGGALKLHIVQDDGAPGTRPGPLTIDTLRSILPFDDHEFFLCGPPGFMQALYDGLRELGVRDQRIQAEAFGPASLKRRPDDATAAPAPPPLPPATEATVSFLRSGDTAVWTPAHGSLLEFAEGKGLSPPYACRAGHCGSCLTPLRAGRVTYAEPTAWTPGEGEVLLCCARPAAGGDERIELEL